MNRNLPTSLSGENSKRLSIAPMMDWTDRACRTFHRILSPNAHLYTEMVTTGALIHGDHTRYLISDSLQHPVILQLGGSEPEAMAQASEMAAAFGYGELNINCGCPSERVQKGAFGACLMKEADLVARNIEAMRLASGLPITVKCRIGVDDMEGVDFLHSFIATIRDAGCRRVIIHARKAWLKGLSPKQNREVPPLDYPMVYAMKAAFPAMDIEINGGITAPDTAAQALAKTDGIMIGREAYHNPWCLRSFEAAMFNRHDDQAQRIDMITAYTPHALAMLSDGVPLRSVLKPMIGLFNGQKGARQWRRGLSELPLNPSLSLTQIIEQSLPQTAAGSLAA